MNPSRAVKPPHVPAEITIFGFVFSIAKRVVRLAERVPIASTSKRESDPLMTT